MYSLLTELMVFRHSSKAYKIRQCEEKVRYTFNVLLSTFFISLISFLSSTSHAWNFHSLFGSHFEILTQVQHYLLVTTVVDSGSIKHLIYKYAIHLRMSLMSFLPVCFCALYWLIPAFKQFLHKSFIMVVVMY